MGTQTMGSNGEGKKSMWDGLSRQGSLYNLTLDEVQQQLGDLGKPFSSMNLDELLKSVYIAEANQGVSSNPPNYTELTQLDSGVRKKTADEVCTFSNVFLVVSPVSSSNPEPICETPRILRDQPLIFSTRI
ncbi:hypothetical protein L1987_45860 [Smallanthus sonchifolius]|uniref:Uncharacterized protein n=1 Tax=Smallanthus sonchifolius TaxID=185202 RepID=A0ACB9FZV0_9ASTR|nr:hypothetical protein L1987_45860 [Smallanthus sonchifolius]